MRSSRMSLGGGGGNNHALRASSSRLNARSSSVSRRKSIGGAALECETPHKDRRAMLDEWRRQVRGRENEQSVEPESHKRPRVHPPEAPPLPPSNKRVAPSPARNRFTAGAKSASSLQDIRHRIKMQQEKRNYTNDENTLPPQQPVSQRQTICYDDDDEGPTVNTPSLGKRLGSSGPARRRASFSVGALPRARASPLRHSQEDEPPFPMSQLTTQSEPTPRKDDEGMDTVEVSGMRSRVQVLEQRIKQLEKEKMDLSMQNAPKEVRFRQKEDAWMKEQNRLLQEIDSLMTTSKEMDERCRDLQEQRDSLQDDNKKLQFAARKAASSLHTHKNDNTVWSRQLQNDRDVADLKDKLAHADEEIRSLRLEKVSVEKEVNATNIELEALIRNYDELQAEYHEISASSSENSEAEIKLEVLTTEHTATSAQLNAVCADLAATKARAQATMEGLEEKHKQEVAQLQFDMSVLKTRAGKVGEFEESSLCGDEEDDAVLRARIEERDRRITDLEEQVLDLEKNRRLMHNQIQELRGNIRVFVRTRPFLPGDGESQESSIDVSPDGEGVSIVDPRGGKTHDFKFDQVFPASSGQDAVFKEVCDFVQSALDGYHVCLFSYGQTGSGKTHTMQGSGNSAMRGIIPRAVEQILAQAKLLQSQKWTFTVSASFLEIYNEELKDLLVSMTQGKRAPSRSSAKPSKLAIKRNREGKSYVDGLTEVKIDTYDSATGMGQLDELMASAARARSVASTKMNSQSSRSHSVFVLQLHGYNEESGTSVHGALNLCDLAGSERLDRSGAASDMKRLRETQSINKSLSCLGDVFNALATGASHVPYRNSKLTYLLQDCLSGDGKALMFVNLSPTTASGNESLCSLRFAQRVNQVELGKATKHVEYSMTRRR